MMMKYDTQRFLLTEREQGYLTFPKLLTSNSPLQIALMTPEQTNQVIFTNEPQLKCEIWRISQKRQASETILVLGIFSASPALLSNIL